MGNSEVGHLNIGAGRVVYQDLVKINIACPRQLDLYMKNPEVVKAFTYAENGKQVHFMGLLLSDGEVHSSLDLLKLCDISGSTVSVTRLSPLLHGRPRHRSAQR